MSSPVVTPRRRRSMTGPVILILLGVLFLLGNLHRGANPPIAQTQSWKPRRGCSEDGKWFAKSDADGARRAAPLERNFLG